MKSKQSIGTTAALLGGAAAVFTATILVGVYAKPGDDKSGSKSTAPLFAVQPSAVAGAQTPGLVAQVMGNSAAAPAGVAPNVAGGSALMAQSAAGPLQSAVSVSAQSAAPLGIGANAAGTSLPAVQSASGPLQRSVSVSVQSAAPLSVGANATSASLPAVQSAAGPLTRSVSVSAQSAAPLGIGANTSSGAVPTAQTAAASAIPSTVLVGAQTAAP